VIEEVVCHDCLDSIANTSTFSLSTSTILLIHARSNQSTVAGLIESVVARGLSGYFGFSNSILAWATG
jgi:hypothetical protein